MKNNEQPSGSSLQKSTWTAPALVEISVPTQTLATQGNGADGGAAGNAGTDIGGSADVTQNT